MGHSRPFRLGCDPHCFFFFFLSKYVMDDPKQILDKKKFDKKTFGKNFEKKFARKECTYFNEVGKKIPLIFFVCYPK